MKKKQKTLKEFLAEEKIKANYQLAISKNDFNRDDGVYFKGKLVIIEEIFKHIRKLEE